MRFKSELVVSKNIFEDNLIKLKKLSSSKILFMIKANAYGHGMKPMHELAFSLGVKHFGLATLDEALALKGQRETLGYQDNVYVFSETNFKERSQEYLENKIIPVISNIEDFNFYCDLINDFKNLPLVLKFNTGMNRLGIDEVEEVSKRLKKLRIPIHHLMTHFSDSYLPKKKKTKLQYEKFGKIKKKFEDQGIEVQETSVSNSGAIENKIGTSESFVRPGLMLYGPQSTMTQNQVWDGKIVSELRASVLSLREISEGEEIGYGSTRICHSGVLVVLAMGYGDGILNSYRGFKFQIEGLDAEIVGRVNMDMILVLMDHKALSKVRVGAVVSLWNESQKSLADISSHTGLIPYEVFCNISSRIKRRYR